MDNNIYKLIKGVNSVDINGVSIRKIRNQINKKKESKTYILNHSTVTDFARFLG